MKEKRGRSNEKRKKMYKRQCKREIIQKKEMKERKGKGENL